MTRFNYVVAPRRMRFSAPRTIAVDNRIRGPLAALSATIVLCTAMTFVQYERLRAAHDAYVAAALHVRGEQRDIDDIDALRGRLQRDRRLAGDVAEVRRAGLECANELTWIGNHLPARTWLRVLRYENGVYSLEGSSERTAGVGLAMLALHDPAHGMVPQLVSLQNDPGASGPRVQYRLRLRTQR